MQSHKAKLEAMRAELENRIAKIDSDFHHRQASTKFSEQVVTQSNDAVLHNLRNEAQFELEQIQRALTKIEKACYGKCESCHEPISDERLDAVPYATQCAQCAV